MSVKFFKRNLLLNFFSKDKHIRFSIFPAILTFGFLSITCPSELHALICPPLTVTPTATTTPTGTFYTLTPTITLTPTQTPTGLGQINVSSLGVVNPLTQPPGTAVTLVFNLTNNQWMPFDVSSIQFQASGTGNDAAGISGVDLYLLTGNYYISTFGPVIFVSTGLQHLGTANYGTDDGQIVFSGSPLLTVLDNDHATLYLVYHFSNTAPLGTYQATIPNGGVQGNISCIDSNNLMDLNLPQTSQAITIANFSFSPTPTYTATPTATGNGPCYLIVHTNPCQLFATQTAATTTTPVVSPAPPTNTPTSTPTNSSTNSPTQTPTNSPTHSPTPNFTDTSINTAMPTSTGTATLTPTDSPTNSPTPTPTNSSTNTPTNNPTSIPTLTPTNSPTPTITNTVTNSPTSTPTNTGTVTPTNTATNTPTKTPTLTPTNTPTNSSTMTPANTSTATPSYTPSLTTTNSPTNSPTNSFTQTPIPTSTNSLTLTATNSPTLTPTDSLTSTPSHTPSPTSTNTPLSTATLTRTNTPSVTGTSTATPTQAVTGVVIGLPYPNPSGPGPVLIPVKVPAGSTVEWSVFTKAFRKILDVSNPISGGSAILVWNLTDAWGRPVANGLYYLRIRVAGSVKTVKILEVLVLR